LEEEEEEDYGLSENRGGRGLMGHGYKMHRSKPVIAAMTSWKVLGGPLHGHGSCLVDSLVSWHQK